MSEEREERLQRLIDEIDEDIDDYRQTVEAIYSFAHVSLWDDGAQSLRADGFFAPGLRMITSEQNPVSPETEVTPDLAVGVSNDWGMVAEAKKSFCRDRTHWADDLQQMTKYDDSLSGWLDQDDPRESHGVVLLLHNSRKVAVSDYIGAQMAAGGVGFARPFAVVAFHRVDERQKYISLERHSGQLIDADLDEHLRCVVQVPMKHLVKYDMRFSDAEPPVAYTMGVLWDDVFSERITMREWKESRLEGRRPQLIVTPQELTEELRERVASGLPEIAADVRGVPRTSWVAEALRTLARFGYAGEQTGDAYLVEYRSNLKEPLTTFVKKMASERMQAMESEGRADPERPSGSESGAPQLSLFGDSNAWSSGDGSAENDREQGS